MRLILIDNNSGYIWGDTADLPGLSQDAISGVPWREAAEAAARALDASNGEHDRSYEVMERNPRDTSTGYHVYRADVRGSDQLPTVWDGQDREVIEAVERDCEYFAYVRCMRVEA